MNGIDSNERFRILSQCHLSDDTMLNVGMHHNLMMIPKAIRRSN